MHKHKYNEEVGGELVVSGDDFARVHIDRKPDEIIVSFEEDNCLPVPCNPGQTDELDWVFEPKHKHQRNNPQEFVLKIHWNVSSVRKIFWKLYYR